MGSPRKVTTEEPRRLHDEKDDYGDWEKRSFMQALVLMVVAKSERPISEEEIGNEIEKYVSNEYLPTHISTAIFSLTESDRCSCFSKPQLDKSLLNEEGCYLYRLATDVALNSSKKKTKCQHSCNCICHKQKGVAHIVACCLPCKECGKNVRGRDYKNHMELCHGKKVVS